MNRLANQRSTAPSVEELNTIQQEWMDLDAFAPEPEKQRVFRLMKRYPDVYVSGHDGWGSVIIDGQPLSRPVPIDQALEDCRSRGGRTDVAWDGRRGVWYSLVSPASWSASEFRCQVQLR